MKAAIPQGDLDSSKGKAGIFTDGFRLATISRKKRSTVEEGSCEDKCKYESRSTGFNEVDLNPHHHDGFSSSNNDERTSLHERCMKKCKSQEN